MRLSTKTTERWPPDWNGNLDLPENERMYVTIIYPDADERSRIRTLQSRWIVPKDDEERQNQEAREVVLESKYDVPYVLEHLVPKIETLEDEVDGKVVKLETGAALRKSKNRRITELIDMIVAKLDDDEIPEDQEKNSEPPSTS